MTAKEIRELRKKLEKTQNEFAAMLKVDPGTISRWERDEQRPSLLAQRRMSRMSRKSL